MKLTLKEKLSSLAGILILLGAIISGVMLWNRPAEEGKEDFHGEAMVVLGAGVSLGAALLAMGLWRWVRTVGNAGRVGKDIISQEVDDKVLAGLSRGDAALGKSFYERPWYLVIGESSCGKTTAIRHAGLAWERDETGNEIGRPADQPSPTHHLEWCFPSNAVLIDTAGALLTSNDERWGSFLNNLKKFRKPYPINGVILAIPADRLLDSSADDNEELAMKIERQLSVARKKLGIRFPVYLMITKCDLIRGFSEFFASFRDARSQYQIIGWSNSEDPTEKEEPFISGQVEEYLRKLAGTLKRRRYGLIAETEPYPVVTESTRRIDQLDALYSLPDNLLRIGDNLRLYLDKIFPPGQSSTRPFFRGLYLTSAIQEGRIKDPQLAQYFSTADNRIPEVVQPVSPRSLFVRDLFVEKVLKESGLIVPETTDAPTHIRRQKQMVAFTGIAASVIVLIGAVVGFFLINNRIREHRAFWQTLATSVDGDSWKITSPGGAELLESGANLRDKNVDFGPLKALRLGVSIEDVRRTANQKVLDLGYVDPIFDKATARIDAPATTDGGAPNTFWSQPGNLKVLDALLYLRSNRATDNGSDERIRQIAKLAEPSLAPETVQNLVQAVRHYQQPWPPHSDKYDEHLVSAIRNYVKARNTAWDAQAKRFADGVKILSAYKDTEDAFERGAKGTIPRKLLADTQKAITAWVGSSQKLREQAEKAATDFQSSLGGDDLRTAQARLETLNRQTDSELEELINNASNSPKEDADRIAKFKREWDDKVTDFHQQYRKEVVQDLQVAFFREESPQEARVASNSESNLQLASATLNLADRAREIETFSNQLQACMKDRPSDLANADANMSAVAVPRPLKILDPNLNGIQSAAVDYARAKILCAALDATLASWDRLELKTRGSFAKVPFLSLPADEQVSINSAGRIGDIVAIVNVAETRTTDFENKTGFKEELDPRLKQLTGNLAGLKNQASSFWNQTLSESLKPHPSESWNELRGELQKIDNAATVNSTIKQVMADAGRLESVGVQTISYTYDSDRAIINNDAVPLSPEIEAICSLLHETAKEEDVSKARDAFIGALAGQPAMLDALRIVLSKKQDNTILAYWRELLRASCAIFAGEAQNQRNDLSRADIAFPLRPYSEKSRPMTPDEVKALGTAIDRLLPPGAEEWLTNEQNPTELQKVLVGEQGPESKSVQERIETCRTFFSFLKASHKVRLYLPGPSAQSGKISQAFTDVALQPVDAKGNIVQAGEQLPLFNLDPNKARLMADAEFGDPTQKHWQIALFKGNANKPDATADFEASAWWPLLAMQRMHTKPWQPSPKRQIGIELPVSGSDEGLWVVLEFPTNVPDYLWNPNPSKPRGK